MVTKIALERLLGHMPVECMRDQCFLRRELHRALRADKFLLMNVPMVNHQLLRGEQFGAHCTTKLTVCKLNRSFDETELFVFFFIHAILTVVLDLSLAVIHILYPTNENGPARIAADGPFLRMFPHVFQRDAASVVHLFAPIPLALQRFFGGFSIHRKLILDVTADVLKEQVNLVELLVAVGPFAAELGLEAVDAVPPAAVSVALRDANYAAQAGSMRFNSIVVHVEVYVTLEVTRTRSTEFAQVPEADEI